MELQPSCFSFAVFWQFLAARIRSSNVAWWCLCQTCRVRRLWWLIWLRDYYCCWLTFWDIYCLWSTHFGVLIACLACVIFWRSEINIRARFFWDYVWQLTVLQFAKGLLCDYFQTREVCPDFGMTFCRVVQLLKYCRKLYIGTMYLVLYVGDILWCSTDCDPRTSVLLCVGCLAFLHV